MPTTTDFNVSPFFDDFDESKRYHRILFRPAVPVQARELTQMQSILQNQIERFGNHVFKNGAIVDGCSITDINPLPYVRLSDQAANGVGFSAAGFANLQVVSATSNLTARIIVSQAGSTLTYPDTNIFFINYVNTGNNGAAVFANNETLNVYKIPRTGDSSDLVATVNTFTSNSSTTTTGSGRAISVTDGIVYQNGFFIKVDNMVGIVNAHSTDAGNSYVGFTTIENIVNFDQDPSLLDNALGYSNETAPGAFRLKLTPQLITLTELQAASANNFNPIATYNYGSLIEHNSNDPYSILDEKMSQRFNEMAGNFVVKPFIVDTIRHASNSQLMEARVSPGKGYVSGKPVELLQTAYVDVRRGIDKASVKSAQITGNYGSYVQLTQVAGAFDLSTLASVDLYDTAQKAASNHNWSATAVTGNKIGTAQVRGYELAGGTAGTPSAVYNVYLFNIRMNSGKNFGQVSALYSGATTPKGVGDVFGSGLVNSGAKKLLWSFGRTGMYSYRDAANNLNSEYVIRTKASATMAVDGTIALTIATSAPGGTNIFPYGIGQLNDIHASEFLVVLNSAGQTANLSGTVTPSTTSLNVSGSGTSFLSTFHVGEIIQIGSDRRYITAINSDTSLTVDAVFTTSTSGQSYQAYFPAGYVVPLNATLPGGRKVQIVDANHATIYSGLICTSTVPVTVFYDVLRTNVSPRKKVINKNRFVKIDTTSNKTGPWCLGFSDVTQLRGVYGSASATYSVSGADLTNQFVFDSGQRDGMYGLGYLYPDSGTNVSSTPYLTVEFDYYSANTVPGVGFYTVESYPVDDSLTANTRTTITTAEIPLYVGEDGARIPLRDYVDFRPVAANTATDTGIIDRANTSQVTSAISLASTNPANTVTLSIPAQGQHIIAPGENFQSDFTYYLPRKDLFYFSPTGALKIKEGVSGDSPRTPLYPDDGMAVVVLSIPPFPSLSLDMVEDLKAVNDLCQSVVRDTSNPTRVSLVTNRRYSMKDIGVLDQRITTLEYYMSLSLLEKQATEMQIVDENGIDRFKNGIFVNPFDTDKLGDVANLEYRIAIDTRKGVARPFIDRQQNDLVFAQGLSSNVVKTGRVITLPYVETVYSTQPYATKYRNAAPAAFKWNGTMQLFPTYDNHVDTVNTGAVQVVQDNAAPWQEFAASPFGTIYGDWQTTTAVDVEVTKVGAPPKVVDVGLNQRLYDAGNPQNPQNIAWLKVAADEQGVALDPGWALGDVVYDNIGGGFGYPAGFR